MGKKPAGEAPKKHKQKHKEMFTELATKQEEIVLQNPPDHHPQHSRPRRHLHPDSEEDVELEVLERETNNLDAICDMVHRLLSKNKVNSKNAFSVPLIDLEQLPDFSQSLQNEYAWKRLSSTLESDYKIYGYRVEAIHEITYNILNTMSRRQHELDLEHSHPHPEPPLVDHTSIKGTDSAGEDEYLERKIQNLNVAALELALGMDPILERTKRQFDQLGQTSMMLDTLPIDLSLRLQLVNNQDHKDKLPPYGTYADDWQVHDPLMAFVELASFRQNFEESYGGKISSEDYEELLYEEKENHFNGNSYLLPEDDYHTYKKAITQEIKFKHRVLHTDKDVAEDADNWMGDLDRKFLGITSKKARLQSISQLKSDIKLQDPAQLIQFFDPDVEENTRFSVFRPQADKLEHKEDVEDRFLLAPRLPQPFQIAEHTLFLKEMVQPSYESYQAGYEVQVDMRRQMVSILEAKKKMKEQLHCRSTFKNIYSSFGAAADISPALCFLTVLHLANQNELDLQQIDQANFYVH